MGSLEGKLSVPTKAIPPRFYHRVVEGDRRQGGPNRGTEGGDSNWLPWVLSAHNRVAFVSGAGQRTGALLPFRAVSLSHCFTVPLYY